MGQICETCRYKNDSLCYCSPNSICEKYEKANEYILKDEIRKKILEELIKTEDVLDHMFYSNTYDYLQVKEAIDGVIRVQNFFTKL